MTHATIRQRWRFAVVLLASLLLAVAQPLAAGLFGDQGSFDVFFSLLIVAVMLLVSKKGTTEKLPSRSACSPFLVSG